MTPKIQHFGISRSTWLMAIALAPIAYMISYYLLSYYTHGDQIWYINFYEALRGASLEDVISLSLNHIDAAEPIAGYILWLGANLDIEKKIYVSLLNVILIVSLFLLARENRVKIPMIGLLLTNYYVVGLMVSAEKLKIAYIILSIAMLFTGRIRIFLLACTPFAHVQSIILLSSMVIAYFEENIKNLILKFRFSMKFIIPLINLAAASAIIAYFLLEGIKNKFNSYIGQGSVSDLTNILILILIAIYITHQRFRMTLILLPLIPIIILIGSNRVNMIAVTLVIYILMDERRLSHPLIYLLMSYFSIKTIYFVEKIILYGDGFLS